MTSSSQSAVRPGWRMTVPQRASSAKGHHLCPSIGEYPPAAHHPPERLKPPLSLRRYHHPITDKTFRCATSFPPKTLRTTRRPFVENISRLQDRPPLFPSTTPDHTGTFGWTLIIPPCLSPTNVAGRYLYSSKVTMLVTYTGKRQAILGKWWEDFPPPDLLLTSHPLLSHSSTSIARTTSLTCERVKVLVF